MNKLQWLILGVGMLLNRTSFASELNITVTNIDTTKGGNIIVFIYYREEGFPKNHDMAFLSLTKKAMDENLDFSFVIANQELAIKVLHDENGDGKVSKNWTGIYPKDGLGFSNNQKITLTGPPNYKKSKIEILPDKNHVIIPIIY
ncbi:DUF2141 domain-containing protein [Psychrosphaera sp. F3M07]|uniref:DUF2141 domain-containing protein n=1 Tax=Psychrosphaera sp. F3M07 TaxID=2841560 RepID=UPI001C09DA0A|nr:DUF2141 domain-containing protein [Psychrosphaera sp. F3M07]MBU2917220.1 DUF2141 domain-containing protein [Psychrosphaera sp. F3M07]